MINNFKTKIKNSLISNEIREFFIKNGIDIDLLFIENNEQYLLENSDNEDTKRIISILKNIEDSNDQHKILILATILELKSQIKKVQEEVSETQKQIEKIKKENQRNFDSLINNKK